MASNEDNDEAEQLRFLALKSMVRRSKQQNSDNDADDQDIKLLRAAALKTITHKSNAQNHSLVNKDDQLIKSRIVNEKKRSNSSLQLMSNKKSLKHNENETTDSKIFTNYSIVRKSSEVLNHEQESKRKPKLEYNAEAQSKPKTEFTAESRNMTAVSDSKDDFKKIVRNGSMQLSNLDSEKIDETMVLHITFSSSESEDSSSECDTVKKEAVTQNTRYNNVINQLAPVQVQVPVDIQPTNSVSLEDNRLKMNDCLKKLCGLMRNCEAEIEKRNQQVKILLEAYEKYQNHNKSLSSILQMMKTVRDELSIYHSLEANALSN